MVTYCLYTKYNNKAYNMIYIKEYLKNCMAYLENPINKTLQIIKKYNQKR